MAKVKVFNEIGVKVDESLFVKIGNRIKVKDLAVILVDDRKIKNLNKKYRKINKPTDVLSFENGDIFISVDTAKRQGTPLTTLFVHGALHVAGYDHNTDEEEAEMESEAKKILKHVL